MLTEMPMESKIKSKMNASTTHPRTEKIQVHTLDCCHRDWIEALKSLLVPHWLSDLSQGIDSLLY